MAHGAPDDSDVAKEIDLYRVDDMAELAVRLGSQVAYRRSGQVVRLDTFAQGLACWIPTFIGVGGAVVLQNLYWVSSGICPRLDVAGGLANSTYLEQVFPIWGGEKVGLHAEVSFGGANFYMFLRIRYRDGTNQTTFTLLYDQSTQTLSYLDSTNVFIPVSVGLDINAGIGWFYSVKLVVDLEHTCYSKLLLGAYVYDISGVLGFSAAMGGVRQVRMQVGTSGAPVFNSNCFVDNFIVTRAED